MAERAQAEKGSVLDTMWGVTKVALALTIVAAIFGHFPHHHHH